MDDRLHELEARLTFQEDALNHLNEVVTRQELRIAHLEELNAALIRRLQQLAPQLDDGSRCDPNLVEIPPHY